MPTPNKGESQKSFIGRCIKVRHSEHPKEPNKKSIAVCFSMWRERRKK